MGDGARVQKLAGAMQSILSSSTCGLLLLQWATARVCKTRRRNAIHAEFFNFWTVTAALDDGARV